MGFLDSHYLLGGASSEAIYNEIKDLPIIDAHNHCDVKALAEDRNFTDIWEAEGSTDHYVWECFRKAGVPEELLTGKGTSNHDKWIAVASAFGKIAGNPTYEWIHLDLKRRLGIDELICAKNAETIWQKSQALLAKAEYSQQSMILDMKVEAMCSTDDPLDTLEYHQALAKSRLAGRVRPTFRPDKAMNIAKQGWQEYMAALEKRWNTKFNSISDLMAALRAAHDFFAENGCRASDHGVNIPWTYQYTEAEANAVFKKALAHQELSENEVICYMSYFINEMAELDAEKDWVFQFHIGAVRDVRDFLFKTIGADAGGDLGDHTTDYLKPLLPLLNRFDNRLKTVLYNMNPIHNATLAQLTRAFGSKVCLGLAWWLNDSYIGMRRQLEYVGSVDILSNMSGMVSDSRKIMSYGSRHEVFRRSLSYVMGEMVDHGQIPLEVAIENAKDLAYSRPKSFFGF